MTKRLIPNLQTALSILFLLVLSGCEEPTPRAEQVTPPTIEEKVETVAPVSKPKEKRPEEIELEKPAEVEVAEEVAPVANTPGHPYFKIYRDGEKLVIEGELKSSGQVKQITSELERFFPKLTVESKLRKDPLRHGVGWGNRISDALLFDYFTIVSDPGIEYKEGTVTLKGTVKSSKEHRKVTEAAIAAFSGVWTSDLVNEIEDRRVIGLIGLLKFYSNSLPHVTSS